MPVARGGCGRALPHRAPAAGRLAYRFAKRAFDVAFSLAVVLLCLVPVALLCAAIRLESEGSPLYRQRRVGLEGRPIGILKLRTMVADSDDVERHLDPVQLEQWRRERKVDGDPRVTKVGRFLRKTSLDELPQFLNVLAGQMSVIGPRPVVEEELAAYGDDAGELLSAKPGITGWWQVQARNDATYGDGSRQELELSRGGVSGAPRRFAQPLRGEGLPAPRLARAPAPRDAWQLPQRPEPPSPQSPPPPCGFTAQSLRSSKFYLRRREAGVYLPATSS